MKVFNSTSREAGSAKDAILKAIMEDTDIARPESLVYAIFTQPYTRVKHLVGGNIYAENTARKYLDQLTDMGVLEKRVIGKGNYYLNLELYRILSEQSQQSIFSSQLALKFQGFRILLYFLICKLLVG